MHLPMFIEVLQSRESADLQICRKIMAQLFRHRISPLPFASSTCEVAEVLHSLRHRKLAPAVFVVNTFWADDLLRDLDALVGNTPILLLSRRLVDTNIFNGNVLQDMDSRPITICRYGAKTVDQTADLVSNALVQFAMDGQFWHLESLGGMSSMRLKSVSC